MSYLQAIVIVGSLNCGTTADFTVRFLVRDFETASPLRFTVSS